MPLTAEQKKLSTEEVCRLLGISKATLHRYRAQGRIHASNEDGWGDRPKALEFTPEEVERFKEAQRQRKATQSK